MLKCEKCGNTEKFLLTVNVEWLCDGYENLVEALESDDPQSEDYQCFECSSWDVSNNEGEVS